MALMRFLVRHNRHHKVSRSSYVAKLLLFYEELGLEGHFVMPIQCTRNLIIGVFDNPHMYEFTTVDVPVPVPDSRFRIRASGFRIPDSGFWILFCII